MFGDSVTNLYFKFYVVGLTASVIKNSRGEFYLEVVASSYPKLNNNNTSPLLHFFLYFYTGQLALTNLEWMLPFLGRSHGTSRWRNRLY